MFLEAVAENYHGTGFCFAFFCFSCYILVNAFPDENVISTDVDDALLSNTSTTQVHQPLPKNQIALLCELNSDHVKLLIQDPKIPMDSQAILAYLLFAASKLETDNIIVFRPDFFGHEIHGLNMLEKFILGDLTSWEIAFFIATVSKQSKDWCICVHHKNIGTVFFDPAIKPGENHRSIGRQYRANRNELLNRINCTMQKLYEISSGETYTVYDLYTSLLYALPFTANGRKYINCQYRNLQ